MSHAEPSPQNELERLIRKAADDPALHGKLYRLLWESELFSFVPDHPEMRGEFPLQNGDEVSFCTYSHDQGPFIPVFTSDAAADWAGEQIPPPRPAIAALPGEALFKMANNGEFWVRVNHGLRGTITLEPAAVAALVRGEFTHFRPGKGVLAGLTLHHVPAEEMPSKLRQAIRVFCVQRPLALGVYAFHPANPQTGAVDRGDLRLIVWLRDETSDLYNDFRIMVEKLTPPYLTVHCAGVTSEKTATLEFLQGRTPLWPIV